MCLENILPIPKKYQTGEHVGYKVLYPFDICVKKDIESSCTDESDYIWVKEYSTAIFRHNVKLNQWVVDDKIGKTCNVEGKQKYQLGFHIFVNEKDAHDYAIERDKNIVVKVKFRDVVAYGLEKHNRNTPVVVAKQMYVDKSHID